MNQLISDKGVYRTAPATQGLLNIVQTLFSVSAAFSISYFSLPLIYFKPSPTNTKVRIPSHLDLSLVKKDNRGYQKVQLAIHCAHKEVSTHVPQCSKLFYLIIAILTGQDRLSIDVQMVCIIRHLLGPSQQGPFLKYLFL